VFTVLPTARPAGGTDERKSPAAVCIAARGESKVNVMGGPTAMTADSAVIAVGPPITGRVSCAGGTSEHRLNLARS